jgi:hypothetical protein
MCSPILNNMVEKGSVPLSLQQEGARNTEKHNLNIKYVKT